MTTDIISPFPPRDGKDYENQCARCGSLCDFDNCYECDEGLEWETEDDVCVSADLCENCGGYGGWWRCLSSADWCEAHPLPGREKVTRGSIEWFLAECPDAKGRTQ